MTLHHQKHYSAQRPHAVQSSPNLVVQLRAVLVNEDLLDAEVKQVVGNSHGALSVLPDELASRHHEELVNLLEGLVLGLVHKEDLVEPAEHRDSAVEAQSKAGRGEGLLHAGEVVGDDEGGEEEPAGGGRHAVGAEVGGVDFGGDDPGQGRVGAEEEFVQDQSGEVHGQAAVYVALAQVV